MDEIDEAECRRVAARITEAGGGGAFAMTGSDVFGALGCIPDLLAEVDRLRDLLGGTNE